MSTVTVIIGYRFYFYSNQNNEPVHEKLIELGMSTSNNLFDNLIFDKNLRAKSLMIDKELDVLVILFNTGFVIKSKLSDFPKLDNATKAELEDWRLIKGGVGIRWEKIDKDLSIRGLLEKAVLNQALRITSLKDQGDDTVISV